MKYKNLILTQLKQGMEMALELNRTDSVQSSRRPRFAPGNMLRLFKSLTEAVHLLGIL